MGVNSVGLEKGSVEGSPSICLPVLSVLLGPWGKFRWPRKRFSGFCGRFPQLFFQFVFQSSLRKRFCGRFPQLFLAFVSQSFLVMWKVPLTLLCICLPVFSGYVEGSPNSCAHLSLNILFEKGSAEGSPNIVSQACLFFWVLGANSAGLEKSSLGSVEGSPEFSFFLSPSLLFEKGFVEGSPNFSLHLSPSLFWLPNSSVRLSLNFLFEKGSVEGSPNFFRNSALGSSAIVKGFFPANGFRLPKGSLECSPNNSLHLSHSLLRFFRQIALASEKVQWRVPPSILYICLPSCFIKAYLPVSSRGQSCVNCSHVSPIQIQSEENNPSCHWCWGILWAYF